ncbi:hypothetical protein ASE23_04915 [Rhizobium sp. Root73]|uniref:hypothetical protein n=1 Tax=unclassified Rhizobium TaxID=2613769 RepID=UPI00071251DA|nr:MULTISPECIES: hypothetical protein [unclassified Rhizobium]KQV42064.1 hypothetical protein ASC96_01560 [Rhizobium sp. Root1204]KQY17952.1 hypothetical protein ASD36_04915 [Rhizobium sp. Root1334]KRC13808.1 hypothetical protein ASE23_04915 [Rhizobium sp. Root73]
MKMISLATLAALSLAPFVLSSAANAMSMTDCSAKYKTAQSAGTLNGMKWNDFRKAQCGTDAAATSMTPASTKTAAKKPAAMSTDQEPTMANTENMPEPAKTTAKAPKGVVFPTKVDSKYSTETAGKARMHTCLDQYKADKADNSLNGLAWIQKGGGFYSICNSKLKS